MQVRIGLWVIFERSYQLPKQSAMISGSSKDLERTRGLVSDIIICILPYAQALRTGSCETQPRKYHLKAGKFRPDLLLTAVLDGCSGPRVYILRMGGLSSIACCHPFFAAHERCSTILVGSSQHTGRHTQLSMLARLFLVGLLLIVIVIVETDLDSWVRSANDKPLVRLRVQQVTGLNFKGRAVEISLQKTRCEYMIVSVKIIWPRL